jgi:uncharacterized RDD family membrane protein YckC
MHCVNCGGELPDDARFCAFCGRDQRPVAAVDEAVGDVAIATAPTTVVNAVAAAPASRPHPWLRYWARSLDLFLLLLALAAAGLVRPDSLIQNLLALYLFVPIETALLAAVGTTPGKWLFRISVHAESGGRPTLLAALRRTFGVLVRGMGLLIPVVSLLAQVIAYMSLMDRGTTAWDRESGCRVLHGAIGPLRMLVIFFVFLTLLVLAVVFMYPAPPGIDAGTEI